MDLVLLKGVPTAEVHTMGFESSEKDKEEGNEFFRKKQYAEAVKSYTQGLEGLHAMDDVTKELMIILYANRAAAYLGLKAWDAALQDCSKALELDPNHEKAIFRRAQVSLALVIFLFCIKFAAIIVLNRPLGQLGALVTGQ